MYSYLTRGPAVAALLQRDSDLPGSVSLDEVDDFGALPVVGEHGRDRELLHFHRLQHSAVLKR